MRKFEMSDDFEQCPTFRKMPRHEEEALLLDEFARGRQCFPTRCHLLVVN